MSNRTKLLLFLLIITAVGLSAQDFGIAVQDQITAPLINPAAMGVGNSGGLSYSQGFTEKELLNDDKLLISLGGLAYAYHRMDKFSDHLLACGGRIIPGLYTGASWSWPGKGDQAARLGLSLLHRPLPYLSFAVKGENLNHNPYTELGIGIRPPFASSPLTSRLTLSGDARLDEEGFDGISLGAFLEPLEGLKIYGDYNFQEESFSLGVTLSFGYGEMGSTVKSSGDSQFENGNYRISTSWNKQRTFLESGFSKTIEYDLAEIISDSPGQGGYSLMSFIQDMEKIKADSSTDTLIFRNQTFRTSFANLLEIETLLKEVKDSGKKIYFYCNNMNSLNYALAASVADKIYLNPAGMIYLKGFTRSRIYMKDFFADWGIRFQNFQSHPYKTAYNSFSESGMTEEERESLETLYDGLQAEMNRMLENGRGMARSLTGDQRLTAGPFVYAAKALELGLVDGLLYEDQFDKMLKEKKHKTIPYSFSKKEISDDWEYTGQPTVALIYASGNIHGGTGIAGQSIGSDSLRDAIRRARMNPLVHAIVLRVDSGGGSSLASDLIAREVVLCRSQENPKPVIVSMGGTAASGGYYIAAPANSIIASPASITGSIGVIALFPEISGLLEKFRINTETVIASEGADAGSPLRSLTEEETKHVEAYIAENYDRFISLVGEYREMPKEDVHSAAQGRVWTGTQAKERGLVDETGGLALALSLAGKQISKKGKIRIIEIVPGRGLTLMERVIPSLAAASVNEAILPEDLNNLMEFYKGISRYEPGEALYLLPYTNEELGISPNGFP